MRKIKSMDELKDGDLVEIREIKVTHGELGTFRGEFFTISPDHKQYGLVHDSWRVRDGRRMIVPARQVKDGKVDFSTIDRQNKNHITTSLVGMTKDRIDSGWQEVYILDDILEGNVKIEIV